MIGVAAPVVHLIRTTFFKRSKLIVEPLVIYDDLCEYLRILSRVSDSNITKEFGANLEP